MKKQTKVLLAAAMLTLGASFSALAAEKGGTWQLNEDGWQYADKSGEYVESKWCVSYDKEFWINDEYVLGSSQWVEEELTDGTVRYYYAQSDGSKTISDWKYLYAPTDDEETGEEAWYYFDAKGRMVKGKKEIKGYTYYFDNTGKMLTGWVDTTDAANITNADAENTTSAGIVYTNEDGQLVKSSWIHTYPWTMTEDNAYEEDYKYYYAGSKGALATTKTEISDLYYFFDATTAQQIDGWVKKINVGTEAKPSYVYTSANAIAGGLEYYWTAEDSYAKMNQWLKLATPQTGDSDEFWYWFDKNGKLFVPTATDSNVIAVDFVDGETNYLADGATVGAKSKKFGSDYYFFNQKGEMVDGLVKLNGKLNYLVDGVRQTGTVALTDNDLDDYTFYFAAKTDTTAKTTKFDAVNGYFDGHVYKQGQLMKAVDDYAIVKVGNLEWLVDVNGNVITGTKEYTLDEKHPVFQDTFKLSTEKSTDDKGVNYTYAFEKTAKDTSKYSIKKVEVKAAK